nr:non-ribosomal peptide synthetase [[Flexibacter] sp. ATCC 35208]
MHFVPSMLNAFIASVGSDVEQLCRLGSLRKVITSGEALSAETVSHWYSLLPEVPLYNLYGPTEASIDVTAYSTHAGDDRIPIGRPIWNTSMYVLDNHLCLVPEGIAGELYIAGAGLARGYLNRPELTASRFISHPYLNGVRMYRTGDIGRWLPDGNIEYLGRADDQVKIRGYRIELGEIENTIQHYEGVDAAVVMVRKSNDGDSELIAFIAGGKSVLNIQQIRLHLSRYLSAYMVPAHLILLDELPLTANGKVNRKELLELDIAGTGSSDYYVAPRNELEEKLVLIWQEILGKQHAHIGIYDSFFSLGGDSIKGVRMVVKIRQQLAANITTADLYMHQSIAQLSERITGNLLADTIYHELAEGEKQIAVFRDMIIAESKGHAALPENYGDIYPIAPIEQGMIYSSLLRPEEPVYYDQFTFYIQIADQVVFHAALAQLVNRHPILRTKYYMKRFSRPVKVVLQGIDVPLVCQDLAGLSDEDKNRQLNAFLQNDASERLEFDDDLLWKFRVFHLSEDNYFVVLSVHHAALDGWSVSVFATELSQLLSTDKSVQLVPLKYSYKDYCALLLGRREQPATELYWKNLLDGYSRNKLPFNYKGVKVSQEKGMKKVYRQIDKDVLADINRLVSGHQLSFKSVCLAAHVCMLHILSTEADVVTGMVTHDRPEIEDSEYILGCFLNTLPVRVDMSKMKDILSLLRHVQQYTITSKAHELHLSEIARIADGKASIGNPIFDTLFNYTDFHAYEKLDKSSSIKRMTSTLQVSMLKDANEMTNTLMDVEVDKTLDRFLIKIKYAPAYLSDSEAQYALNLYVRILSLFAKDVTVPLSSAKLLTAVELKEVVTDFNDTIVPYPEKATLHGIFEAQVIKTPSNIALVQHAHHMTYSSLNERANQLSWFLIGKGVKPGDNIGLLVNRSFNMMIGMYGILKAGGAYVPIDPHYPADRQEYIARNSGLKYIVTDEDSPLQQILSDMGFVVLQGEVIDRQPVTNPGLAINSRQLAYTIYTSGSTGRPKGVMIAHHAAVNLTTWVNDTFQVGETDRLLFITSMCFDLSVYDIFGMLSTGGALVIAQQEEVQDVRTLSQLLQAERITFWDSVPTTMNYLVSELDAAGNPYLQHDLRLVFLSGDWIPVQLPGRINTYFPQASVISLGGATEGTVWSNYYPVQTVGSLWSSIPYGVPISNNFFYILDEQLQPVPKGVVGELYIGGVGVAEGYANDAEKTAAAFKRDPFNSELGGRMYKTGDLGRLLPDGNMEFIGRKDNQVKIRGFRVELGEIESMLQKHSSVTEAIVDVIRNKGNNQLCAYLVVKSQTGKKEIREYLKQIFPDYMIPDYYVFLSALPLNSNGKIDRKALPAPLQEEDTRETGYHPPVTILEKKLAAIWQSLLMIEKIGVDDDFFELGANSLSVGAFVSRLSRETELKVSIREVFAHANIRRLADVLESRDAGRFEQIEVLNEQEGYQLSAAQWRMWLLAQLGDGNAAYHIPGAYVLEGTLDKVVMTTAFEQLVARHESLRTVFREDKNGELKQYILPILPSAFSYEDLCQMTGTENVLRSLINKDMAASFDLAAGPLLRVKLYKISDSKWVFTYVMHHIISDGWSMGILINELLYLYNAGVKGEVPVLKPLRIQYKDYAAWQQKQLSGVFSEQHKNFWLKQFEGRLPVLELPVDMIRPAIKTYNGGQIKAFINRELANGLKALAREQEATLFMSLLGLVNALLYNYTGQEDIILGTAVAGRDHVDLENQIGFYVNTLALRTRFKHSGSFRDLLHRVKGVTLAAYEHQVYPFDTLADDLSIKRDLSRNLLFDVMVVLQNTRIGNTGTLTGAEGLSVTPYEGKVHLNSQFDLAFDFLDTSAGLQVIIEYNSDIFYSDTIKRMIDDLELLLKALLNNPDQPLSQLLYGYPPKKNALINDLEL